MFKSGMNIRTEGRARRGVDGCLPDETLTTIHAKRLLRNALAIIKKVFCQLCCKYMRLIVTRTRRDLVTFSLSLLRILSNFYYYSKNWHSHETKSSYCRQEASSWAWNFFNMIWAGLGRLGHVCKNLSKFSCRGSSNILRLLKIMFVSYGPYATMLCHWSRQKQFGRIVHSPFLLCMSILNPTSHKIAWAIKSTNIHRLPVTPQTCGILNRKSQIFLNVTCEPFEHIGYPDDDRITIKWVKVNMETTTFSRELLQDDSFCKTWALCVKYNL